jgi:hypothetical protein
MSGTIEAMKKNNLHLKSMHKLSIIASFYHKAPAIGPGPGPGVVVLVLVLVALALACLSLALAFASARIRVKVRVLVLDLREEKRTRAITKFHSTQHK